MGKSDPPKPERQKDPSNEAPKVDKDIGGALHDDDLDSVVGGVGDARYWQPGKGPGL